MSPQSFKKKILVSSIAAIISSGVAMPVFAQQGAEQQTDAQVAATSDGVQEAGTQDNIETIQVSGIRGSQRQNLSVKRYSNAIVDSITAQDIGQFPDKNVAESLSRITGVGVSREFGEGEKITIRGSAPNKNRTLLNGQNVATADWFILDSPSRGFNFTLLPSNLVQALEVYKSPTASSDEGSIGGSVNMRTRTPFELDSNTVRVSVQGQYSEASEKTDPQYDALYSWKSDDEMFGALVSYTSQERTVQREGLEVLGWTKMDNGYHAPKDIGNPIFKQDRERETIFASLQYAPLNELVLTFNYLDSTMDANNTNTNLLIRPQNDINDLTNIELRGNNVVAASVAEDGAYEWDFINRRSKTETDSYQLIADYTAEAFTMQVQLGSTEARGGTYDETSWSFVPTAEAQAGYSFDLRGKPQINSGVDPEDGSLWGQNWTWGGNKPTKDEEKYAQVDFDIPVEYGPFDVLKIGGKYRDHKRHQGRHAYSWHADGYMWEAFEQCPTLDTCDMSKGTQSVAKDVVSGNVTNQLEGNRNAFWELGFGPQADYAVSIVLAEVWEIEEEIFAGYAQGDFSGDGFRGNLGVRVVKTDQTSKSYNFSGDSWGFWTIDREWLTPSYVEWVSEDRSYTEILPSFNVAFDATDEQIIRFSAARVMARPDYADLSSTVALGDLNGANPTAKAGNPKLNPQIADQFDLAWEWYFEEDALLSFTFFYKDIKSYRTSETYIEKFYNEQISDYVDVEVTKPANGLGGVNKGIEVGYQQAFGDFGISANYTYTDADSDQIRNENAGSGLVEGASENMFNGQVYYETEAMYARLMYNYRDEWYKGLHFSGDELWNDAFGQLDFSAGYTLNENINFTFEAVNITDEQIKEYNTDKNRVMSRYENGRRFVLGVNFVY